METYRRKQAGKRKGELVQAIQVQRPYRSITAQFPRSHQKNKPGGALDYIRIVDAPEGSNRAGVGDWVVKFPDGLVTVINDEAFQTEYGVDA